MLVFTFIWTDRVSSIFAVPISFIPAGHAPSKPTSGKAQLVSDVYKRVLLPTPFSFSRNGVKREMFSSLCVIELFFSFFCCLLVSIGHLLHSCLMNTDIINHISEDTRDILVSRAEGDIDVSFFNTWRTRLFGLGLPVICRFLVFKFQLSNFSLQSSTAQAFESTRYPFQICGIPSWTIVHEIFHFSEDDIDHLS